MQIYFHAKPRFVVEENSAAASSANSWKTATKTLQLKEEKLLVPKANNQKNTNKF